MDRLRNRRGVTLVLTAFMLTALIGSAAFAIDFGRMYWYRAQLSAATDAAALAGAFQILKKKTPLEDSVKALAVDFAGRHRVGLNTLDSLKPRALGNTSGGVTVAGDAVALDPNDVTPGNW